MATNAGPRPPNPNDKILNVWSKPIEQGQDGAANDLNAQPTISNAVSTIKADDFKNVAQAPCARNAFLTGIASGFGAGGLRFVVRGNPSKATNWAVGFFLLGSAASYEYCQFQRRAEKRSMKRHVEVISQTRREQAAAKLEEQKKEQQQQQEEELRRAKAKSWYKFW